MRTLKSFVLIFASMMTTSLHASDFVADGIYYNIIEGATEVEVTNNLPEIAYSGAVEIPTTVIDNGVTYDVTAIGNAAFIACAQLTAVVLPHSITNIGSHAFVGCSHLASVHIPSSVTQMGSNVFMLCPSLQTIELEWEDISTVSFGENIFQDTDVLNCIVKIPKQSYSAYEAASPWNSLPNVWEIDPDFIVDNSGKLIEYIGSGGDIIIPHGVKRIANNVFEYNSTLQSVIIPSSVTDIGSNAFLLCDKLLSITIPSFVIFIDNFAFIGCENLQEINLLWSNPNSVANEGNIIYGGNLFYLVSTSCIVNVPEGLLSQYNIYPWSYFDNISSQITGIPSLSANNMPVIYVSNRNIIIENASEVISIYNLQGVCITQGTGTGFPVTQAGIYIVKTGEITKKVIVK